MTKLDFNYLLLNDIQDTLGCVLCSDIPNETPLNQCIHGHKICSLCHGSVHTHGCLLVKSSKFNDGREQCDSGYFEVDNDVIKREGTNTDLGLIRMSLDSRNFFGVCWRDADPEGLWHISLYINGLNADARKYIFTAKICDNNYIEEMAFTSECVPIHIGREEMIEMGRCLTFNDKNVKRFCSNNKLNFYFQIRRNPLTHIS